MPSNSPTPTNADDVTVRQAEEIATRVASRCHGDRKPGQAAQRYATIYQAARLGAIEALSAHQSTGEVERLREENVRLKKMLVGEWFYPGDGYDQEVCHYSPDEVIDYLDLEPGDHVVEVSVATSLPSIWCAVRVTDDEDADERYTHTEHTTKEEARAALAIKGGE